MGKFKAEKLHLRLGSIFNELPVSLWHYDITALKNAVLLPRPGKYVAAEVIFNSYSLYTMTWN